MAKTKAIQSASANPQTNPMWGGHYAQGPAEAFAAINPSIGFDWQLYNQDIAASIAHCTMLGACNIIAADEAQQIEAGLNTILAEIKSGAFEFTSALEDIHMNIESRLTELIGDVAGKLHTARSRNDQVATDFRLYVRDTLDAMDASLQSLQAALLAQASQHAATIMPGFTHLQPAQPIMLGHHLMAYVDMFGRDRDRLRDARTRVNQCPLGAAALAGTSFPIDRQITATALGFDAPMTNSLDAVADRDFVLEPLAAFSLCALHLSRLSEELILWSTPMFGFVTLPENFTSGSSIMPQKRNPDAAELIRGKTGRIIAAMNGLMITLKALPLAYNKDTQEDKEPFFDASRQLGLCLQAMTGMIESLEVKADAMKRAAEQGYSTATDLADWLVQHLAIPFRTAHHITGKIVKIAEEKHCRLEELSLDQMQSIEPRITPDIFNVLSVESSVNSRISFGGTAPASVREAIATAHQKWILS